MELPSIPSGEALDTLPDEAAVLTREEDPPALAFLPSRRDSFDDEPTRKAHAPRKRRVMDGERRDDEDTEKWASSPGIKPKH